MNNSPELGRKRHVQTSGQEPILSAPRTSQAGGPHLYAPTVPVGSHPLIIAILETDVGYILETVLPEYGYMYRWSTELDAGIQMTGQMLPDAVILNIDPGGRPVSSVIREIRGFMKPDSNSPILITYVNANQVRFRSALEAGADDFVDLWAPINNLLKTLKRTLMLRHLVWPTPALHNIDPVVRQVVRELLLGSASPDLIPALTYLQYHPNEDIRREITSLIDVIGSRHHKPVPPMR